MTQMINIAVLCGGQSAEHAISLVSARNIIAALDKQKYRIHVVLISKSGDWYLFDDYTNFLDQTDIFISINSALCTKVTLAFGTTKTLVSLDTKATHYALDVVFPVLHGALGEDGTLQGLLEIAGIPYIGPGVLSSAICMDKEVTKQLLKQANINIANWLTLKKTDLTIITFEHVVEKIGLPFFVKPINTGSSVGITKVKQRDEFLPALTLAFEYDNRILLEQYIQGREIECSALGNEQVEVSLPGEIICHHEFYSYAAKYVDPHGADLAIPAQLPAKTIADIQNTAKLAYQILRCEGMARIDFFVTHDGKIFLNEANTIPGFTEISMYPKLWQASGLSYSVLLDRLIELALQRFERDRIFIRK